MNKNILFGGLILSLGLLISCQSSSKKQVDFIVTGADIYTVDSSFSTTQAMAIKAGKIVALGTDSAITSTYQASKITDFGGKTILPGLYDAHTHFLEMGQRMQEVNLRGTKSYDEVIKRVIDFQNREHKNFITGMGWDQTNWPSQKFPNKAILDSLYPNTPVVLVRIDGHAILVNQKTLDLAGIDKNSRVEGGKFIKENGELTGVLVDNARQAVRAILPKPSQKSLKDALMRAQELCFQYGLTSVAEAGLSHEDIQLMDSLALTGDLKIGMYPMIIYNDPHLDAYLYEGLGDNKGIPCKAIKLYADGALGSRGAALKEPYSDDPHNHGIMRVSPDFIASFTQKIAQTDFQLNTHAIGDSADHVVLKNYAAVLKNQPNRRWRVEHAQIVDSVDLHYFSKNIIPSVQPTHAISDMNWAEKRLGAERIHNAYANKRLLDQAGIIALGTDAPIEVINPFRTFYTAVARKNSEGKPKNGYMYNQHLSRKEALKGMTIWAAYAQFEENTKGSLEPGKQADFIVLDRNIMTTDIDSTLHTKVLYTFIKGQQVYPNL